jgi:hypothetical protein
MAVAWKSRWLFATAVALLLVGGWWVATPSPAPVRTIIEIDRELSDEEIERLRPEVRRLYLAIADGSIAASRGSDWGDAIPLAVSQHVIERRGNYIFPVAEDQRGEGAWVIYLQIDQSTDRVRSCGVAMASS